MLTFDCFKTFEARPRHRARMTMNKSFQNSTEAYKDSTLLFISLYAIRLVTNHRLTCIRLDRSLYNSIWVVVCLSGNVLVAINEVTLR